MCYRYTKYTNQVNHKTVQPNVSNSPKLSRSLEMPKTGLFVLVVFLGVFTYLFPSAHAAGNPCITIPISLSNVTSCSNGTCVFSQQAEIAIPSTEGSQMCVELVSPDGKSDPIIINVTLTHAHYNWLFDYGYYTDSVVIWAQASCDCSFSTSRSCDNCPAVKPRGSTVQCIDGSTNGRGCILPGLKRWCAKIGYEGYSRYKILHSTQVVNKDFGMIATIDDEAWLIEYDGITQKFGNKNQSIEISILSDTSTPNIKPEFIVFDQNDMSDFYFLSGDDVNGINDFNPFKLGWFKAGQPIELDAQFTHQNMLTSITSCNSQSIELASTFLDPVKLLKNNVDRLSASIAPGSILEDRQWNPWSSGQYVPNHEMDNDIILSNGFIYSDAYNNPDYFGITRDGIPVPNFGWTAVSQSPSTLAMNLTSFSGKRVVFSSVPNPNRFDYLAQNFIDYKTNNWDTLIMIALRVDGKDEYFACKGTVTQNNCASFSFQAIGWPFLTVYNYTYVDGQFSQTMYSNNHNISDSMLITHSGNGILNMLLTFTNLTIKFDSSPVSPVIIDSKQQDNKIVINAYSATVGGDCFIASQPAGVIITQPITLSVTPQTYKFQINSPQVDSDIDFQIRCYSKQATTKTHVQINQQQNQSDVNYVANFGGIPITYGDLNFALNPINDWLNGLFGTSSNWWSKIVTILIYVAVGILAVIVITKIVFPLLFKLLVRFPSMNSVTRLIPKMFRPNKYSNIPTYDDYIKSKKR